MMDMLYAVHKKTITNGPAFSENRYTEDRHHTTQMFCSFGNINFRSFLAILCQPNARCPLVTLWPTQRPPK